MSLQCIAVSRGARWPIEFKEVISLNRSDEVAPYMCIPQQTRRKQVFKTRFFDVSKSIPLPALLLGDPTSYNSYARGWCFLFSRQSLEEGGAWRWEVEGHHAVRFLDNSVRKLCMAECFCLCFPLPAKWFSLSLCFPLPVPISSWELINMSSTPFSILDTLLMKECFCGP